MHLLQPTRDKQNQKLNFLKQVVMKKINHNPKRNFLFLLVIALLLYGNAGLAQNRDDVTRLLARAKTAYEMENYEDALREYKKVQKLAPNHPDLYKAKAVVYKKLGSVNDLTSAMESYETYLRLAPKADDRDAILKEIASLEYIIETKIRDGIVLDDLSGVWVAMDNLTVTKTDRKTLESTWHCDFIFEISEIQKTGKYTVTIQKEGSRYYRETIIEKTVYIVPQKDFSFNFTIADAQVYTPNQGAYSAAKLGAGMLGSLTGMGWLGDAANVAVDIKQFNDLPSNTQTSYTFALKYVDGKLKGLVNVVQKFADPNQQRTLENGLYEITFVKKGENFRNEIKNLIENKPDILYPILNDYGNKTGYYTDRYGDISSKEIKNKISDFNPQLGERYQRAKNQETIGMTIAITGTAAIFAALPVLIVGSSGKNAKNHNERLMTTGYWLAGAGLGTTIFGLSIGMPATYRAIPRIVKEYNDQVTSQPKRKLTSQLNFGVTPSGNLGAVLTF
jgi:tetratricopeptide (TPR) repeat protein